MFRVETNPARHRVDITFIGQYREHDATDFERDMRAAISKIRKGSSHFDMLVDFSDAPIMSQDTAAGSIEQIAWCIANGLRKSANITPSAIMKLQLQRVTADSRFRNFPSKEEAIAWLDSAD